MKNQALFSLKDKSKKLKCHLLQFLFGLNIFYLVLSVHTFIHERILVQALGLERKQYAYRVLLPNFGLGL